MHGKAKGLILFRVGAINKIPALFFNKFLLYIYFLENRKN